MQKGTTHLKFFTTLTTLGTLYDITLHELHIESFFPADEATDTALRRLDAAGVTKANLLPLQRIQAHPRKLNGPGQIIGNLKKKVAIQERFRGDCYIAKEMLAKRSARFCQKKPTHPLGMSGYRRTAELALRWQRWARHPPGPFQANPVPR